MAGRVGEGSGNVCPVTGMASLSGIMAPRPCTPAGPQQVLDVSVLNKWVGLSALQCVSSSKIPNLVPEHMLSQHFHLRILSGPYCPLLLFFSTSLWGQSQGPSQEPGRAREETWSRGKVGSHAGRAFSEDGLARVDLRQTGQRCRRRLTMCFESEVETNRQGSDPTSILPFFLAGKAPISSGCPALPQRFTETDRVPSLVDHFWHQDQHQNAHGTSFQPKRGELSPASLGPRPPVASRILLYQLFPQ